MKKCIIFCAGEFKDLVELVGSEDIVIAADGGMLHLEKTGLIPNVILGDFDSLGYVPEGAEVFPVEKDDTDCMLAIKKGLSLGCDTFLIYGGMDGKRTDHTVANFQALQYLADRGCRGFLMGRREVATVIKNSQIIFPPYFIGHLSAFCMGPDAEGVSIRGTQYEMEDGTLTAGFPLAVSNHFIQKKAIVSVRNGSLLLIWRQVNGVL